MNLNICTRLAATIFWGLAASYSAGGTTAGDEVVVLYNTRMPGSKGIADYYAGKRHVPPTQVFGFPLSIEEAISRKEFEDSLQRPLAKAIANAKLWRIGSATMPATTNESARVVRKVIESKIRYAVLCWGVPLCISEDPDHREPGLEKLRTELRRNVAAVDSELALLPLLEQQLPLAGPLNNPTYGVTNAALLHPTNGILIVARLDGPTAGIARGLVDKALQAEADGLWGRAYFDLRNISDPMFKPGDDWIRNSAEICKHLGIETTVDENAATFPAAFPMSHIAFYAGWYTENVSGPFAQSKVEFMPGAFAYHLHSYSAATLRSNSRNWVGPLLARGATASMGCVTEPYLTGTPDIGVFTARFLFHGFTFGEAATAAQPVLSWQTTIVGDPLYAPFARSPEAIYQDLRKRGSKLIEWSLLRLINLNLINGKPGVNGPALLEELEETKSSSVLSEKLGDLCAAQGKPSSAVHAYQQALRLEPSPQQRLRLLLILGEKLVALNREQDAYDDYRALIQQFPEYPDKATILRRLLPLAQKLNKKADAEAYEAALK